MLGKGKYMKIMCENGMGWEYFTADEIHVHPDGRIDVYAYDSDGKPYHDKLKVVNSKKIEISLK